MSAFNVSDSRGRTAAPDGARWLRGGGDMGARMRALDWGPTPLGPPENWPQSLRSAVSICLGSRFPMVVLWGPQLVMIYNDAYAPLLGDKHPWALGRSIREVWSEIADVIAPLMEGVMKTGEATWIPDGFLALERHGAPEETYFSYSFGPARIEDGSVGGILAVTIETTQRVVSERRLAFLKALAEATAGSGDAVEVCAKAMAEVGAGTQDIPHAAIYLRQPGRGERLVARSAPAAECPVAWTEELAGQGLPGTRPLAVPIRIADGIESLGTLVVGLNPQRPLDEAYREFIALAGRQIARSISDVKALELERARAHADQELRRIFEQAPSFVCILKGPDHVFEFVNKAHLSLFNSAGWLGKAVREAFPDLAGQGYFERLDEVYRTGIRFIATSAPVRYRYSPQDDEEERLLDFIYEPIRDEGGGITGIFCEGFDVTAQRRAETALRQQEERLRALIVSTSNVVYSMSPDWSEMRTLDGRAFIVDTQAPNRSWLDEYIHPDDQPMVLAAIQEAIGNRSAFHLEHRVRTVDGTLGWTYSRAVPIVDAGGEIVEWFGAASDITSRKKMEETLRNQADQLREGDQRKDEFIGILAHELRNPLSPLKNGLEIIRRLAPKEPAAIHEVRAVMDRQLAQMVRLIDDLLDVSRISSGKIAIRKERVPLADVLRHAVETSQPAIDQAGHKLTVTSPGRPVFVDADPARLAQVFSNLLTNAAKFTARGGQIQLTTERNGAEVGISVRDNGEGIPRDMLSRIFDMFVQVDRSLEREKSGLGIGLSLARGLVTLHGGSIEARSEGPKRGSEFLVRLPVAIDTRPAVNEQDSPASPNNFAGRRVLVVDDNVDAASSLAMLLELVGCETKVAHNGVDAVTQADAFRPELVFLDIGMPGLNGYEACARIKKSPWGGGMIVVALTGWGQEKDRVRSREAGFDGHLVKPVSPEAISALMEKFGP